MSSAPRYLAIHRQQRNATYTGMLAVWAVTLGALAAVLMLWFTFQYHVSVPIADEWSLVGVLNSNSGHYPLAQLWAQHNEDRIPFVKLLAAADLLWFHGTNSVPIFSIYLARFAYLFLVLWVVFRWARWPHWLTVVTGGLAAFTVFWPSQWDAYMNPYNSNFAGLILGCTLAPLFLILAASNHRRSSGWLAASIAAAWLAELSLTGGLLVWPLLIAVAVRFRMGRKTIGILSAVAIGSVALYFAGYAQPAYHAKPMESLQRPWNGIEYLAAYLAGSWRGVSMPLGYLLSYTAIIAAPAFWCWEAIRAKTTSFRFVAISVSVLYLGIGVVTALSHLNFGTSHAASSRYQGVALSFWLAFCLYLCEAAYRYRLRYAVAVCAGALVCATAATPSLFQAVDEANGLKMAADLAVLPMVAGVNDRALLTAINPETSQIFRDSAILRERGASMFRNQIYLTLGTPISGFALQAPNRCFGEIDAARRIPDLLNPGWGLTGWAWDHGRMQVIDNLIAVTDGAKISGFGASGLPRADVPKVHTEITNPGIGWRLFLQGASDFSAVKVYGIVDDGKSICLVKPAVELPSLKLSSSVP